MGYEMESFYFEEPPIITPKYHLLLCVVSTLMVLILTLMLVEACLLSSLDGTRTSALTYTQVLDCLVMEESFLSSSFCTSGIAYLKEKVIIIHQ